MRGLISAIATSLVLVTFTGCGSQSSQASGELSPELSAVTLNVRNDNFQDMDLYAVHNGASTRIGTAIGNSSGVFKLNRGLFPTNDIAIVAVPIGGFGRASSGTLSVSGGEQIDFNIMPVLSQSNASVRPPR